MSQTSLVWDINKNQLNSFLDLILSISTKGNLGAPKSKPIVFNAAFIGIGLVSQNRLLIKGMVFSCIFFAVIVFPSRKFQIISCVYLGFKFDKTEIQPKPPREQIGIVWSSLPEYM